MVVDFPAEYFSVISSSRNGTHHRIRTSRTGRTVVYGKLTGVVDHVSLSRSAECMYVCVGPQSVR